MNSLTLNRVFTAYLVVFTAVIVGLVPREVVVYVSALLIAWAALAPLDQVTLFFVRSVPLFIAIPLTASYDNLNLWRPVAVIIAVRLFLQRETRHQLAVFWRNPTVRIMAALFALAALSLIGAAHPTTGLIRIIYFANLVMVPTVLWILIGRGTLTVRQILKNLAIPTVIVIAVGYLQLLSTYLMDVYQFMHIWGEGIQLRQFGSQWSQTAVRVGNTWLAYYGPQLSLRVFSLFPDSHSFPVFVLLGIPALLALEHRSRRIAVPLALLMLILSGTRGIWAAAIPVALIALYGVRMRPAFRQGLRHVGLFFLLFAVAWPIFISPQFLLSKGNWGLLRNRIKSIVDFGETSNALRLQIWQATAVSIAHHPLLGVGIGNFPVVLGQDIRLAKAGSSAHNIYLHIAAEMGIPALGVALWFMYRTLRRAYAYDPTTFLYLIWVAAYLMTDAALFDERAFLMFGFTAALIHAHE